MKFQISAFVAFCMILSSISPIQAQENAVMYSDWGLHSCGVDMVMKTKKLIMVGNKTLFSCFEPKSKSKLSTKNGRICPGVFVTEKGKKNQGTCQRF
jgi:uncharacterized paraquat-inducible protein A